MASSPRRIECGPSSKALIMTIKEIKTFVTPDGVEHPSKVEAEQHLLEQRVREALDPIDQSLLAIMTAGR